MNDSDHSAPDPPDERMTLTTARVGSAAVVTVRGELDLHTARELMSAVDEVLNWPDLSGVVVDLTEVSFLGSSGLGTLAELATRTTAASGGGYRAQPPEPLPPLRLVAPPTNRAVIRPWKIMNLQQILPLHPDVADALRHL